MDASTDLEEVDRLARETVEAGLRVGLPFIASSPDIGSPAAMRGSDGRALNATVFHWLDPHLRYWEDRGFALRSAFVHAARVCSEPFYFDGQQLRTWRPNRALEAIRIGEDFDPMGVASAIVAPAYLPAGVIGAVVWAAPGPVANLAEVFDREAVGLHALALRLIATHAEATRTAPAPTRLTRREIQCLRWAAAGKTDQEIGRIVHISAPTVRFHLTNASRKLNVNGRSQAIHRAAGLGYIGGPIAAVRSSGSNL